MSARTVAAGVLALVVSLMLILCIFLSWYTVSATTSSGNETYSADLYPDQKVAVSATSGTSTESVSESYSDARLNNTGNLYTTVEIVLIVGGLLGVAGAGLLIAAGSRGRSGSSLATLLIVLAFAMAIAGPVATFIYQPSELSADSYNAGSTNTGGPGPMSTFFGSESVSGGTASWGPALGWYLSIVVFVLLIVSLAIVPSSSREEPRTSGASSQPAGPGYGAYAAPPGSQYGSQPPPAQSDYPQYAPVPPPPQTYYQPPSQVGTPPPPPPTPAPPPRQPGSPDERFCPACGMGNLRASRYCERCGSPLPPPR
jgi:membrane protein implicated in regulation of membrane protease activity